MDSDLEISWRRMWQGIGAAATGSEAFHELLARYSEPWRKYHTLQHLRECVAMLAPTSDLAARPAEVEAALWFHDAICEPRRGDNEERSAELARSTLAFAGVGPEAVDRVAELVRATKHSAVPTDTDAQLLVDIDLAILGAARPRFAEYARQIRDEYSFVPEALFREKRLAVLRSFLDRPQIYATAHFQRLFERRARINLARSLEQNAR